MGDASGVGPEIVLRSASEGRLGDDVVVYGDASILEHGAGTARTRCRRRRDDLNVVDLGLLRPPTNISPAS